MHIPSSSNKASTFPLSYNAPIYVQKHQFFIPDITNEKLTPAQLKHCQEFCGFFNYYARAIGNTTQTAVSAIASSLSTNSWKDIKFRINQFLDYSATNLMSKFDIIQAKCTYGFTQTPLISMNQNIALVTVVSSTFLTNPNSQSNQRILHQNSMHQL